MKKEIDFCDICGEKKEVRKCELKDGSGYQLYCERCGKENKKKEWLEKIYLVNWETDNKSVDLPDEISIPVDIEEKDVANYISDKYGWLIKSLTLKDN